MKVLAFDFGATSIRGIIGDYSEGKPLELEEVLRENHKIQEEDGRLVWDFDFLLNKVVETILKFKDSIDSIAIDTWGIDFGLLDEEGKLVHTPFSYRDPKNDLGLEDFKKKYDLGHLFELTGTQIMAMNSLFQLFTMNLEEPDLFHRARYFLSMPDLINYFLTGQKQGEKTMASTTQMYDMKSQDWCPEVIHLKEISHIEFPKLRDENGLVGTTKTSPIPDLQGTDIPVVSIAAHDTASAVALTKAADDPETLFLSSGTWSLLGCFSQDPILTEEALAADLTNEAGYKNRSMFFKNITGLYLIEQLRTAIEKMEGHKPSFDEINHYLEDYQPYSYLIDVENPCMAEETDNFIEDLDQYLDERGQEPPQNKWDYFGAVYEGLVHSYLSTIQKIHDITGRHFNTVHVIGGGSQSSFLCKLMAERLQMKVLAGPKEATALGNIYQQLEIAYPNSPKLKESINQKIHLKVYEP